EGAIVFATLNLLKIPLRPLVSFLQRTERLLGLGVGLPQRRQLGLGGRGILPALHLMERLPRRASPLLARGERLGCTPRGLPNPRESRFVAWVLPELLRRRPGGRGGAGRSAGQAGRH